MGGLFYQWPTPARDVVLGESSCSPWIGKELKGSAKRPFRGGDQLSEFSLLKGLARAAEVDQIIRIGTEVLEARVQRGESRHTDSVDGLPTFEWHPLVHGNYEPSMEYVLRPMLEQRLTPYVREKYGAPSAVPCTCLFRRYIEEERRVHPVHFDHQSFVTVVFGLNPGEFEGGLFLQGDLARDRLYIHLDRGDACCHQYDLHHGVHVFAGTRYSLIVWYMDTWQACIRNTRLWYFAGAQAGDPDAMNNWATCLEEGDGSGLPPSFESALPWYKKAADMGSVHALNHLGRFYWEGRPGIKPCAASAEAFWLRAAHLGYSKALSNLGGLYLCGSECPHGGGHMRCDPIEGIRMLKMSADRGDLDALFKIGYHGRVSQKSDLLVYLKYAADLGHAKACACMAEICRTGELGIRCDLMSSVRYTRWAAHLGVAQAMNNLGGMHCTGEGAELDVSKAVQLFRSAAEKNDPDAQMNLALCFQRGVGVNMDLRKALRWCERSSAQGHSMAMRQLADFKNAVDNMARTSPDVVPSESRNRLLVISHMKTSDLEIVEDSVHAKHVQPTCFDKEGDSTCKGSTQASLVFEVVD